jgi:hypothetical protein
MSTAVPASTTQLYTTYKQIGKAEDVSDLISNITPFDTPFTTLIKSEKMSGRTHEWQEDSLASAAVNKQHEGVDATFLALTPTVMRENNTQILSKACVISNTSDAVKTYGRAKETALQLAKKMKEIKRDLEFAFVHEVGGGRAPTDVDASQTDVTTAGAYQSGAERQMKSAAAMISSDHIASIGTVIDTTVASSATPTATQVKVTETAQGGLTSADLEQDILGLHQTMYDNGSDADIAMIPSGYATTVAGFIDDASRHRDFGKSREIVNVVDVYISPFGTLKFVINRHQNPDAIYLLDPSMWRSMVLRPFTRTLLAPTGDHTKHYLVGEYSLKHMNFKGSGMLWRTTYTGVSSAGGAVINNTPAGG